MGTQNCNLGLGTLQADYFAPFIEVIMQSNISMDLHFQFLVKT